MAKAIAHRGLARSIPKLVWCTDSSPVPLHPYVNASHRSFKSSSAQPKHPPNFAFAFDIDGVLLRSSSPIPNASRTLKLLQSRSIPFILLTNGGGKDESDRVEELSRRLEVPLDTDMFIQSHTPFAELVTGTSKSPALKNEPILVVGGEGDKCRRVAEKYGFTNVITPGDIYHAYPEIWPFSSPFKSYYSSFARSLPLPAHTPTSASPPDLQKHLRISSIFVFNDVRDWGNDLSLILDFLLSHKGCLGTISPLNNRADLPNRGFSEDGQPTLYFANPDLWWAASWHLPRLGTGGFMEALEGVWRAATGGAELRKEVWGKPHAPTFQFAERKLVAHRRTLLRGKETGPLENVYMVGDNPSSDILGANSHRSDQGTQWHSILVRSGVYDGKDSENFHGKKSDPGEGRTPRIIVDDVWEGVSWALKREGIE